MIASLAAAFLPALAPPPLAPQRGGPRPGAQAPAQGAADPNAIPPIQDDGEFYVLSFSEDPSEAVTLAEFVKVCQEATGRNFTYDQQTDGLLQAQQLRMFGTKRIPKADFYAFFQIMMFINDFATIEVGPPHLSVVVIQSLAGTGGGARGIRQRATYVDPSDLDQYANQPAVLITTTVNLPNSDVRQLSTSLRALLTDNNTQNISPAGQSNNLVLTGFGSNIAALANLLILIDEQSAITPEEPPVFDVIPLEFASPEEVADLIDQLLEASNRNNANRPRAAAGEQGVAGSLGRNSVESKILVDSRTNSLLVMAAPDEMPRIKDLVARLDVDVIEPERNFHIYSLQNVSAEDISDVLEDFLDDSARLTQGSTGGRTGQGGTGSTGGSSRDSDVVVVPDPGTNSLLIAANKTRYEELLDLIRQLDRRQDQVLIETALVELTGSNLRDMGFELGGADIPGAGQQGAFGVTSFGLSTIEGLGTDDPIRVPTNSDGITAGILDGDSFNLPILMKLLQTRDNANVLSVPSILVNNNGSATVSTVDEQPFTQITATGGVSGQTQENFQGYEDAGITLTISPSISASRYLRLGVELSVSSFAGAFSGSIPPPRTTRELRTSVNVPDGDTMVIGGIISDNSLESTQDIPFLSDIPVLGALFQRKTTSNSRTTLYFFVTPHILHDKDFADLAQISYEKKLRAAEVIGLDRIKVIDPDFGTSREDLGLEPFEVPLYRSPERGEVDSESVGLDPIRTQQLLEGEQP